MNELLVHNQPHSEDAEEKLIATCLVEGNSMVYDRVSQIVTDEDFYTLRCKLMFKSIGDLALSGEPIDEIALSERLKAIGGLDEAGERVSWLAGYDTSQLRNEVFLVSTIEETTDFRRLTV